MMKKEERMKKNRKTKLEVLGPEGIEDGLMWRGQLRRRWVSLSLS